MQETQETQVGSLGWEDPLETDMATQSSVLTWKSPWTEEPGGLQSIGLLRARHDWSDLARTHALLHIKYITNRSLLYNTGSYSHYLVITYNGKESKKEYIYIYIYMYLNHFDINFIFTILFLFLYFKKFYQNIFTMVC